jgi:hypothetical protein
VGPSKISISFVPSIVASSISFEQLNKARRGTRRLFFKKEVIEYSVIDEIL